MSGNLNSVLTYTLNWGPITYPNLTFGLSTLNVQMKWFPGTSKITFHDWLETSKLEMYTGCRTKLG